MASKFKYYATIGNNGYGLTKDWMDIVSNASMLDKEWHKGFNTKEEAYNWLMIQIALRQNLNGICDLDNLVRKKFVFVTDIDEQPEDLDNLEKKLTAIGGVEAIAGEDEEEKEHQEMFKEFIKWYEHRKKK